MESLKLRIKIAVDLLTALRIVFIIGRAFVRGSTQEAEEVPLLRA